LDHSKSYDLITR